MVAKTIKTPVTDRGVETSQIIDTIEHIVTPKYALNIDYFTCTIKEKNIKKILSFFEEKTQHFILQEGGIFGYQNYYLIHTKIKIFFNHSHNNDVLIWLSGKACRELQAYYGFDNLFKFIKSYEYINSDGVLIKNYNITRIDLAKDFYNLKYDLIKKVTKHVKNGLCTSKFKIARKIHDFNISDGSRNSDSIRFGSMSSNISIIFYNKLQERTNASYKVSDDIKSWYRMEVNYRQENANNLFDLIYTDLDHVDYYNSQIIYNYLDFKIMGKDFPLNKWRLKTATWWLCLLTTTTKLSIASKSINSCIMQKKTWINTQVSKSLLQVLYTHSQTKILKNILKEGYSKLKKSDIDVISDYLQYSVSLSDVYQYISDISQKT